MKPFITLFLLVFAHLLWGQSFRDASGILLGYVDEKGTIREASGTITGWFDRDGIIRDKSGVRVAEIDPPGIFRNASGVRIGEVSTAGRVADHHGSILGRIQEDGIVRNRSGVLIGYAKGIERERVAYLYFFRSQASSFKLQVERSEAERNPDEVGSEYFILNISYFMLHNG